MLLIHDIINRLYDKSKTKFQSKFDYSFIFYGRKEDIIEKYYKYVNNNVFFSHKIKENYFNAFTLAQKHKFALKKFLHIWRFKRLKHCSVETDLLLTPLTKYPDNQKIKLIHINTIYTFRLTDIINIWMKSLTHSISLSPEPQIPKNPYLNIEFTPTHLWQVYIKLFNETRFRIPNMIHVFIKNNMSLEDFRKEAYPELIHIAIETYISVASVSSLYLDCINMVARFRRQLNTRLYNDVDQNEKIRAVKLLKPTLKNYIYFIMSCNPTIKIERKLKIIPELVRIFNDNPNLGRRNNIHITVPNNHIDFLRSRGLSVPRLYSVPTTPPSAGNANNEANNSYNPSTFEDTESDDPDYVDDMDISDPSSEENTLESDSYFRDILEYNSMYNFI